ncbi:hypothetical protein A2303_03865 [Candidatus Falkowbacteria bacterium RIFOXYB2_FULL_47_14]|uniref:SSD domain-containing protein n=1 Tax=Candidatus Falkowbacteria bacterium RIFOXYA2_FULL_47_19 TaxID=1797994 RepID=A0A1F5SHW3_9BACT|nr:MAG: hypothetical protein A2227_03410 [Candidatus Falkowbacteria bacterium RIFOXYA2_FULL_47_19]OGF35640.1 MAG: hypothetical protein A2468_02955 [Candidatus Falkowbacteria bacterium RIFOXYC2_FULL_46_15]OGF42533.1 MAG: hypothetical protein A2303_03865 [Candidatus Falkowbacteria bacterium RIFOXYB2_FULL_47_14]
MESAVNNEEHKQRQTKKLDAAVNDTKRSVLGFLIINYRITYLVISGLVLAGVFAMFTLPREAEPEIRIPYAVVTTIYPGANPVDIEELVTRKIEDEIKNLENVKLYSSTSGQGVSSVFVEYEAEADLDESFRKLREAANNAEAELPTDAETPIVTEINFTDMPIVTYSLVGAQYDEVALKKIADDLEEALENVKDVSKVVVSGGLTREFRIAVDQTKLSNYGLSLGQVVAAVGRANVSLPAGNIGIDDFNYDVRVKGRFKSVTDLYDIVVATQDGSPVFLKDLGRIEDAFKDKKTESKIGFRDVPAEDTVSLLVYKRTGGNILDIVDNTREEIDDLYAKGVLPSDLKIQKTNDNSVFIKEDLNTLGANGIQTMILITLILMLVLSFRGAVITALSVPMAFLMAFMFLKLEGLTLNSMVLFSLVLSLGLMVDNSIVIIEGINEYVTRHKKTVAEAALLSVWNFKWAITSGTMTTVAAFLPMLLVSGILGQYISVLPKTITVTLISSLFVALVVVPVLAARFIKIKTADGSHRNKKRHRFFDGLFFKIHGFYGPFLQGVLISKAKRRLSLAIAAAAFLIAVGIPAAGFMKIEMFPKVDLDYFLVSVKLPAGSTLALTRPVVREAEKIVNAIPEMDNYVVNIGQSQSVNPGEGGKAGENLGGITVNLVEKDLRDRKSYEIADSIRGEITAIQGGEVTVEELSAGPPTGAPIEVRIFGDTLEGLTDTAGKIKKILAGNPDIFNVKDNIEDAAGEFTFEIDRQKADYYGLDMVTVASTLRTSLFGNAATEINLEGDDVDITVKYDQNEFKGVDDLEKVLLPSPRGYIAVKDVASVSFNPALLSIQHRDGAKYAAVSADIKEGANLQKILDDFEKKRTSIELPPNFSIKVGGEVEDIEKSFRETFMSLGLAVILIAFILVLQFNSFKQPFIILFSLPLAIVGVVFGLLVFGQPFSFLAFIGIVSLAGIVVNDAIVLIDRINKNIEDGLELAEAIVEAGISRMQPIFLTSLTTIAGVFPLIWSNELWRGFSLSLSFGLVASTILTLYIVPIMFVALCRKDHEKTH